VKRRSFEGMIRRSAAGSVTKVTIGYCTVTIGYCTVTIGYCTVTEGY
jgi:hypothetical protein